MGVRIVIHEGNRLPVKDLGPPGQSGRARLAGRASGEMRGSLGKTRPAGVDGFWCVPGAGAVGFVGGGVVSGCEGRLPVSAVVTWCLPGPAGACVRWGPPPRPVSPAPRPPRPLLAGTWGAASLPATGSPALLSPLMRAASSLPATQRSFSRRRFLWKNLGELGCPVFTSRCMCRIAGVLPTIHLACGHRALSAARVPTGARLCVTLPPDLHAVSHVSHVGCASQQC